MDGEALKPPPEKWFHRAAREFMFEPVSQGAGPDHALIVWYFRDSRIEGKFFDNPNTNRPLLEVSIGPPLGSREPWIGSRQLTWIDRKGNQVAGKDLTELENHKKEIVRRLIEAMKKHAPKD